MNLRRNLMRARQEWEDFQDKLELEELDAEDEAINAVEDEEAGLIPPASTTTVVPTSAPSRPPPGLPVPSVATVSAVHTTDIVDSTSDTDMDTDRASDLDSHLDTRVSCDLDISGSSATDTTEDTQAAPACAVCNGKHAAAECCTLRELGLSDRLGRVRALHLCFVCLRPGHMSRVCQADMRCEVSECQRRHATVLHGASWPSRARSDTSGAGHLHTRIVQAGAEQDSRAPPPSSPVVQSRGPDARGPEAVFSGPTIGSNTVQKVKVALPIVTGGKPLSTVAGRRGEPYAVRTCLGWLLHGVLGKAQSGETTNACLVVADSGSSELTARRTQEVEQGAKRTLRRNSAHQRRSSSSAGLERSSGWRGKRRRRKESGVPSSGIVSDSLLVRVTANGRRTVRECICTHHH